MVERDYRIEPPQVSKLLRLQVDEEREHQYEFWAGYNTAIQSAIAFADQEELRVRGIVEAYNGVCLDDPDDRQLFLNALYGTKDNITDRP
jgi:hypothetical protein